MPVRPQDYPVTYQSPRLPLEVIENVVEQSYNEERVGATYWPSAFRCALTCRALARPCLLLLYAYIEIESEKRLKSIISCVQHYPSAASLLGTTQCVTIRSEHPGRWVGRIPLLLTWLCPNISTLVLDGISFASFGTPSAMLLRAFGCLRNVRDLTLRNCEFHNLGQVLRTIHAFPALNRLAVSFSPTSTVSPGRLQVVYASPVLSEVELDNNNEHLPLTEWLLGGPSVRALTISRQLRGNTIMKCLRYTAPHLEELSISRPRGADIRMLSLSSCNKLRVLTIIGVGNPHVLLLTLPAHSALRTLELRIDLKALPDWGKIAGALRSLQLARLRHVAVRSANLQSKSEELYRKIVKGGGRTTLHELRMELRNSGVAVTIIVGPFYSP